MHSTFEDSISHKNHIEAVHEENYNCIKNYLLKGHVDVIHEWKKPKECLTEMPLGFQFQVGKL